jgi:DNA repair photolyase
MTDPETDIFEALKRAVAERGPQPEVLDKACLSEPFRPIPEEWFQELADLITKPLGFRLKLEGRHESVCFLFALCFAEKLSWSK